MSLVGVNAPEAVAWNQAAVNHARCSGLTGSMQAAAYSSGRPA